MKKNSKGYTLILVLIVLMIMAILGTVLLELAVSETKLVVNQETNKQAYDAARSGADAMASYIISNPNAVQNIVNQTSSNNATGTLNNTSFFFNVNVVNGPASNQLIIKSRGFANGVSSKVSLTLDQVSNTVLNSVIFSDSSTTIGQNSTINGDIVTNGSSIGYGNHSAVNGKVTLGSGATTTDLTNAMTKATGTVTKLSSTIAFPSVDSSLFQAQYNKITDKLTDGAKLLRYTNDSNLNNVDLTWGAGHVSGQTAELHLFVSDTVTNFSLGTSVIPKDGITLYIYYNGSNVMTGNGGFTMTHLCIYAPSSIFAINGGGNGSFNGKMIVKSATFPNSHGTISNDASISISDIIGTQVYKRTTWGSW